MLAGRHRSAACGRRCWRRTSRRARSIAWKIRRNVLDDAFEFIAERDPFSGHVVIRNSETGPTRMAALDDAESSDRLLDRAALRVSAQGRSAPRSSASCPRSAPSSSASATCGARGCSLGEMSPEPAQAMTPAIVDLSERDWNVLTILKRDFAPDEIGRDMWERRAIDAGVDPAMFFDDRRGSRSPRRHRTLLDISRAHEAGRRRRARVELQRTLSLGRAGRDARSRRAARSAASRFSRTATGATAGRSSTT